MNIRKPTSVRPAELARRQLAVSLMRLPMVARGDIRLRINENPEAMELLALLILAQKYMPKDLVMHDGGQTLSREWLVRTMYPNVDIDSLRAAQDRFRYLLDKKLGLELGIRPSKSIGIKTRERTTVELELDHLTIDIDALLEASAEIRTPGGRENILELAAQPLLGNAPYSWLSIEPMKRFRDKLDSHYLLAIEYKVNALLVQARAMEAQKHYARAADLRYECLELLEESDKRVKSLSDPREFSARHLELRRRAKNSLLDSEVTEAIRAERQWPIHNIPSLADSFVGRERDIINVRSMLATNRLVTITGLGGGGKTRLAIEAARRTLNMGWNEVWLVELAGMNDPTLLSQAIATVLQVTEKPGGSSSDTLLTRLRQSMTLLILDNCEHMIQATSEFAEMLLRSCPKLRILATSRERLGVNDEALLKLSPLSCPKCSDLEDGLQMEAGEALKYEAVQLFVDRLKTRCEFTLDGATVGSVLKLCSMLDGIPLALELAAANVGPLSLEQVVEMLSDPFSQQKEELTAGMPRHTSMKAVMDASYDLMTDQERTLFCRLAAPPGGLTLEAARHIGAGDGIAESDVLELIGALSDRSLISVDVMAAAVRYRMPETLRQYGQERLRDSGTWSDCREAHREFFLEFAENADFNLDGTNARRWLNALEADIDNLRLALEWRADASAMRLACALQRFWHIRGRFTEGRRWLDRNWEQHEYMPQDLIARSLIAAGNLQHAQGDFKEASQTFESAIDLSTKLGIRNYIGNAFCGRASAKTFLRLRHEAEADLNSALDLFQETSNESGIADVLHGQAVIAYEASDYPEALHKFNRSIELNRKLGNKIKLTQLLMNKAILFAYQHDFSAARSGFEESLALQRELENVPQMARLLTSLGEVARLEGKSQEAESLILRALTSFRKVGDAWGVASAVNCLGMIYLEEGDYNKAEPNFLESRGISLEVGQVQHAAAMLGNLGIVCVRQNRVHDAKRYFGDALLELSGLNAWSDVANLLDEVGMLESREGSNRRAIKILKSAEIMYNQLGCTRSETDAERIRVELSRLCDELGGAEFDRVVEDVGRWSREQIVAFSSQGR